MMLKRFQNTGSQSARAMVTQQAQRTLDLTEMDTLNYYIDQYLDKNLDVRQMVMALITLFDTAEKVRPKVTHDQLCLQTILLFWRVFLSFLLFFSKESWKSIDLTSTKHVVICHIDIEWALLLPVSLLIVLFLNSCILMIRAKKGGEKAIVLEHLKSKNQPGKPAKKGQLRPSRWNILEKRCWATKSTITWKWANFNKL